MDKREIRKERKEDGGGFGSKISVSDSLRAPRRRIKIHHFFLLPIMTYTIREDSIISTIRSALRGTQYIHTARMSIIQWNLR